MAAVILAVFCTRPEIEILSSRGDKYVQRNKKVTIVLL